MVEVSKKIVEVLKQKCFKQGLRHFVTDEDFKNLASMIARETGTEVLGVNTWKRILGKLPSQNGSPYRTSSKTANIIADYLGCDSWEQLNENFDYVENQYIVNNTSTYVNPQSNSVARLLNELRPGDVIEVKSYPNKLLHLKLLRRTTNSTWYKVIKTTNSRKLSAGDELEIPFIQESYPLHAISLNRNGSCLGEYASGVRQVVYSVRKI